MRDTKKLQAELNNLEYYFKKNNIPYLKREAKNEYLYDFQVSVKSYISNGEKIFVVEAFQFCLSIPNDYPLSGHELRTRRHANIPFHPHFRLNRIPAWPSALWVDYKTLHQESLRVFMNRMIRSLRYEKGFYNLTCSSIGNESAKDWVSEQGDNLCRELENHSGRHHAIQSKTKKKFFVGNIKTNEEDNSPASAATSGVASPKKFRVVEESAGYKPIEKSFLEIHTDNTLDSLGCEEPADNILFIVENAQAKLWDHIKWGDQTTPINKVEQGGLLLGNVYNDSDKKLQYAVVESIVEGFTAEGNSIELRMDHATWSDMISRAESLLEDGTSNGANIIGWYHTHPNNLDVFMSDTDRNTQRRLFSKEWQYAIVLNPHSKVWRSYFGRTTKECCGRVIARDPTLRQNLDVTG